MMIYFQRWAANLICSFLLVISYGCAGPPLKHPVTFYGIAMIENNGPVVGGTIEIAELVSRPFMMPGVRRVLTTTTDENGFYNIIVDDIRGDLFYISLRGEKCKWTPDSGLIYEKNKDLINNSIIEQNFSPAFASYGCD